MTITSACSTPYLFRRGDVWWWRRRLPAVGGNRSFTAGVVLSASGAGRARIVALSLRTTCRLEARRRGARICATFEDFLARRRRMDGVGDLGAQLAQQMLEVMRQQVAALATANDTIARQASIHETLVREVVERPAAATVTAVVSAHGIKPRPARAAPTQTEVGGDAPIWEDPEMEEALLTLAEREGWWQTDPQEIVEEFDWMLEGLFGMHEAYVRVCAKHGLDPATALPSLARIAGGLGAVAASMSGAPAEPVCDMTLKPDLPPAALPAPDAAPDAPPSEAASPASQHLRSNLLVSEVFDRYLDMRTAGFTLDPRAETASPKLGAKFAQTMRPNIESTKRLIIDILGDKPLDALGVAHWRQLIDLLPRLPRAHGKSAKDKRAVRDVVADADRDEALTIERERARLTALRMQPQEIDAALARAAVPRLSTATCVRHLRDAARVIDYAIHHGFVADNHLRPLIWSAKEIKRRQSVETNVERMPWKDEIYRLFRTPVFQGELDRDDDPLFWAPLLGELAGLRLEEALQLRLKNFKTDEGVPFIDLRQTHGDQSIKSEASERVVPLHRHLVDLGILELVAAQQRRGFTTLFPMQTRGATKGRLSENFSKRFTHYRKRHRVYSPELDFHSFRAGFTSRLKLRKVPREIRKELIGHELTETIDRHYEKDPTPIPMLKEFVDRLELDVSMIKSPFQRRDREIDAPTLRVV
jgi:integrase